MEVGLRATRLLDVEARQPHDGARREDEDEQPLPRTVRLGRRQIHDERRREAERDRVDERVELLAKAAAGTCRARDASIERVGDATKHDERWSRRDVLADGKHNRVDAAEEIEEREP